MEPLGPTAQRLVLDAYERSSMYVLATGEKHAVRVNRHD
jgi:hypothetical protein